MAAGPNIDTRRCILQPMHQPGQVATPGWGVCMQLEQRHAEFTVYIPKKTRPAWRIRLGADCPA
jgi:hypothetical protein